jgi:anti-sigma28 factor (negative regulator of flagellin synthesis)
MRSHDNATYSAVRPSLPQMKTTPIQEMPSARGRLTHIDQLGSSPCLREMQQGSLRLAQSIEVRETRIVMLRREIESGYYSVEVEQVAEKIMTDFLLDLFRC